MLTDDPSNSPVPPRRDFPILPIVTPDPPPRSRSQAERFGALFYLGVVGLIVLLTLVGWFGWSVWTLRSIWWNVYVLHDPKRPDADRNAAAYAFSHDPAVNQRQLWDVALRKDLPPLARYVVAEGLTDEAAAADPKGYGLAVARSEGWPDWLRLLLLRPLAYRAAAGHPLPREALAELRQTRDRATVLWATYALAAGSAGDPEAAAALQRAATEESPEQALAKLLLRAQEAPRFHDRLQELDEATLWLRHHHPEASRLWDGWEVVNDHLVRVGVPLSGAP